MNQRMVVINKKKLILTERPGADVQDVFDYYDQFEEGERKTFKFSNRIAVWMVYQSLRSTRKKIPFWFFWRKIKYLKYTIKYLAKDVAPHVLFECQNIILELDELNKKKEEAAERESPGSNVSS
ncbi:MAG: hypothetical protein AB1633_00180 [Elusimicrobiota bacterium]